MCARNVVIVNLFIGQILPKKQKPSDIKIQFTKHEKGSLFQLSHI
jgi:hypothetical protein